MQQNYLLFIVDKIATFCVTFVTEVKMKKMMGVVLWVSFRLCVLNQIRKSWRGVKIPAGGCWSSHRRRRSRRSAASPDGVSDA